MRTIKRTIVGAVIISADGYILFGKKDPLSGGVYAQLWQLPGGGAEPEESLHDAIIREILEETALRLDASCTLEFLDNQDSATAQKRLASGEEVLCDMNFNMFLVRIPKLHRDIHIKPGDDLVQLCWFAAEEALLTLKTVPTGPAFLKRNWERITQKF